MPTLICFSGKPGVGKSSLARHVCQSWPAFYLRLDEIDYALECDGLVRQDMIDAGFKEEDDVNMRRGAAYRVASNLAWSNLDLGQNVVIDCVNPTLETRSIFQECARSSSARFLGIEVVCGDKEEHKRRVQARMSDVRGWTYPCWDDIDGRDHDAWPQAACRIDTSVLSLQECVDFILAQR